MMTTIVSEPAPESARPASQAGHRSREALVFSAATAVALDDAFLHRQPGVGLGQHALAAAVSVVRGLGAVYAFPALRSAVALLVGALATVETVAQDELQLPRTASSAARSRRPRGRSGLPPVAEVVG